MNLVDRAKNILFDPKSEWIKIEREPGEASFLFPNYVMILSAISPVCSFIGFSFVGYGGVRIGVADGLVRSIVFYVLSLAVVYLSAYIIDFFAGVFGGRKDFGNAMRVAAYWETAGWLAGVFNLIPALSFLVLLGLYSIYLLHKGIIALMKPSSDKAVFFTIAVFISGMLLIVVVSGFVTWLSMPA